MRKATSPSKRNSTRHTGLLGESLASQALQKRGYVLVERNWRCPQGEIDIIAQDGDCWVFVEVKTRHGHTAGAPEEALTEAQLNRLCELAEIYLAERDLEVSWRIDLVAIELGPKDTLRRLRIITGIGID